MSCKQELWISFTLSFGVGGYVTALTFITLTSPHQKISLIISHPQLAPLSPRGLYRKMLLLWPCFPARHFSPFKPVPHWASSVPEPGTSCVVEVMVVFVICGALRVRSRLRLSPQHWADLSSLQPEVTHSVYTPLSNHNLFWSFTQILFSNTQFWN